MTEQDVRQGLIPRRNTGKERLSLSLNRTSFGLFVLAIAWAPFPLGSNQAWSWSLLCIVVALCWLLWCGSLWAGASRQQAKPEKSLIGPIILVVIALAWGFVQVLPWVPQPWPHPIWHLASPILLREVDATISVAPWRSETTLMKFMTYALAVWLVRCFASQSQRANFLLNAMIAVGGLYAAYALVMAAFGFSQYALFYGGPRDHSVAAPFFNRDHYATYAGIVTLCAGVRFIERGNVVVVLGRGFRQFLLTLLQYVIGNGALYLVSLALAFSSVVATGSRAANLALIIAVIFLLLIVGVMAVRQRRVLSAAGLGFAIMAGGAALFFVNDAFLVTRLQDLGVSGLQLGLRLQLWNSALLMIQAAPLLGLGLGTYQLMYPMYSDTMTTTPFFTSAAHNDYFELAAGWGLPAALCWWLALLWLTLICLRGVVVRRRNRAYPMIAVGVSVLVGIHSYFDFSLQMPATALMYATILGLGVAQAFPTRTRPQ